MVNVIDFCNDFLGFQGQGIRLFPKQEELLREFYEGDFRELVLVAGRRTGKDFLACIFSLYEAYKLLELKDPYSYYGIAPGNPIHIVMVNPSSDISRIIFGEIKSRIFSCPYFQKRVGRIESDRIWLLTPADMVHNKHHNEKTYGSVVIMSSHCNSEGLLGKRIFCLILNEVACYRSGYSVVGNRMLSALAPATAEFRKEGKLESKIIVISSPRNKDDLLYELYSSASLHPRRLARRYATWEMNPNMSKDFLQKEHKYMTKPDFDQEFGAEFVEEGEDYNVTVSIRMLNSHLEMLKDMARRRAIEDEMDWTYVDLIREAIRQKLGL